MTYQEALRKKAGDMIQPKNLHFNVRIREIDHTPKNVLFTCENGIIYNHRQVNQPILIEIQNRRTVYTYDPVTDIETFHKYEHLTQQHKLLKLICPLGTTVYVPDEAAGRIYDVKITQVHASYVDENTVTIQYEGACFEQDGSLYDTFEFEPEDFGSTVFLDEKDAEEALSPKPKTIQKTEENT